MSKPRFVMAKGSFADVDSDLEDFRDRVEIVEADVSSAAAIAGSTDGAAGLIVALHPLAAAAFEAMAGDVRIVGRAGIGLDSIDLDAAQRRGVAVLHQPEYATNEVATHAVAMLLALHRRLIRADQVARASWSSPVGEIYPIEESRVGVVGCGRIGRAVIERLRPFAAAVVVFDPYADTLPPGCERAPSLESLLERSHIVTLHVPLTPETGALIGREELGLMQPGALLVNVSRGGLIDEAALADALQAGSLGGAALDVLTAEPPPPDAPMLSAPRTLLSPHMAWYSTSSERRLKRQTVAGMLAYLEGAALTVGRLAVDPAAPAAARSSR